MRIPQVLLSMALAASQTQTPPAPKAPAAKPPASDSNTYHSDVMHFSFAYPNTMTDGTAMMGPFLDQEKQSKDPDVQRALKCTTIPLALIDLSSGNMMMLMQIDGECQKIGYDASALTTVANGMMAQASAMPGFKLGSPASYEVAGHPAVFVGGSVNMPNGPTMQFNMACIAAKPAIGCFELISMTPDGMSKLGNLQLTFDGGATAPIAPPPAPPVAK